MSTGRIDRIEDLAGNPLWDTNNGGILGNITTSTGVQTAPQAIDNRSTVVSTEVTALVPSDYLTLQAAIDDLSSLHTKQGVRINIVIEAGHLLTSGVKVTDGHYGHFYISSQDAEVLLDAAYPLTENLIESRRATAPTLNCLVNMNGKGRGYCLFESSRGVVSPGCGVKGSDINLQIFEASTCDARSTIFTGAIKRDWGRNVWISSASNADMQLYSNLSSPTDCSGAEVRNIYVSRRSTLNFANGISSNSQTDAGLYVIRSQVCCNDATFNNNFLYGIAGFASSLIDARRVTASSNGDYGIWGESVTTISAGEVTANNNGKINILQTRGSNIDITGATATGAGEYALSSRAGSHILSAFAGVFSGTLGEREENQAGFYHINSVSNIVESYESAGIRVVKWWDGTMEMTKRIQELVYVNTQRLSATVSWPESWVEAPLVTPSAYHPSASLLPSVPSHFSEFAGNEYASLVVRNTSPTDCIVFATSPNANFAAGNNAFISITAKGRWKA